MTTASDSAVLTVVAGIARVIGASIVVRAFAVERTATGQKMGITMPLPVARIREIAWRGVTVATGSASNFERRAALAIRGITTA